MQTTKYPSIAAWAKALGSSAKTHEGQRKAIIAAFPRSTKSLCQQSFPVGPTTLGQTPYGDFLHNSASAYQAARERSRQEGFASTHPLTLSMPAPATEADVFGARYGEMSRYRRDILSRGIEAIKAPARSEEDARLLIQYALKACEEGTTPVSITDLAARGQARFAMVGGFCIRLSESVTYDKNRYSKTWHRQHGGAKSVDSRTVLIRRVRPDGTLDKRDQQVAAWRGNYLLNALITSGICESHKGLANIRLHAAYDVAIVRSSAAVTIYERALAGQHVDFCAVRGDVTFHAATVTEALAGLRSKVRKATLRANGKLVTYDLCRALGFCRDGIASFCQTFDLSPRGQYTPAEIAEHVMSNLTAARPYAAELRTLASAVGYAIPAAL